MSLLPHDNLDDRREIHHLLARLSPRQRLAFLGWACRQATLEGSTTHPEVSARTRQLAQRAEHDRGADTRLTLEVYFDLWHLAGQYAFDLDQALNQLVELVRAPG